MSTKHWRAALLSDDHVSDNSKGQNIQTLCSRKVIFVESHLPPVSSPEFSFLGLFDGDGNELIGAADNVLKQYMATSISIPDPWSILANADWTPQIHPTEVSKKRARSTPQTAPLYASVTCIDAHMQPWMRMLLCGTGTSFFLFIIDQFLRMALLPSYLLCFALLY